MKNVSSRVPGKKYGAGGQPQYFEEEPAQRTEKVVEKCLLRVFVAFVQDLGQESQCLGHHDLVR